MKQSRCTTRAQGDELTTKDNPLAYPDNLGSLVRQHSHISEPLRNSITDLLDKVPDLHRDELADILEDEIGGRRH